MPNDSNAGLGFGQMDWGEAETSWNLSDPAKRAEFAGLLQNKVLWVEGISSGEGVIEFSYSANGQVSAMDFVKVNVLKTKTVRGFRVGVAAGANPTAVRRLIQDSNNVVRGYDGEDDVIVPIAFIPGDIEHDQSHTFDTVDANRGASGQNSFDKLVDYMGQKLYRAYFVKAFTNAFPITYRKVESIVLWRFVTVQAMKLLPTNGATIRV